MPEMNETPEQYLKGSGIQKKMAKVMVREMRKKEAHSLDCAVRKAMMELWREQAADLCESGESPYGEYETLQMIARHFGSDYDDAKFWSHNTNALDHIPKYIRYVRLYKKVKESL